MRLESEAAILEKFESIAEEVRALLEGIGITLELSRRTRDAMLVHGEQFALVLMHAVMKDQSLPVRMIDAKEVIITDETFGSATPIAKEIESRAWKLIAPRLKRSEIVLIQGFAGATRDGVTTTMGSESSDLTATLLGAALGAEEVVIWKTVPGIFTTDPEIVPNARLVRLLSFAEAEELGRRGARILHPALAHPLLVEGNETILRVADPLSKHSKNTQLQRAIPRALPAKPLALALEQHLVPLKLQPSVRETLDEELVTDTRRRKEKLREIIMRAAYKWSTPVEETICIRREDKARAAARLETEYRVTELAAVSVLSLVFRNGAGDSALDPTPFLRALRAIPIISFSASENSLIAIMPEASGVLALKKAHKEIFGR